MNPRVFDIGGVQVGVGQPCRFIAEISNNHNGNLLLAFAMIHAAKAAGADFVKFQCYTPDELVALRGDGPAPDPWGKDGWTMHTLYEKAQTPMVWFPKLFAYARKVGIPAFSSMFGLDSLAMLERCECPAYKIARLDNQHRHLTRHVVATGKPLIVSADWTDLSTPADLRLCCPPGYPQAADAKWPGSYEGMWDGISYHGTDPAVPAQCAREGARLVEVHFQLDSTPSELEANVSLTESQFAEMVRLSQ